MTLSGEVRARQHPGDTSLCAVFSSLSSKVRIGVATDSARSTRTGKIPESFPSQVRDPSFYYPCPVFRSFFPVDSLSFLSRPFQKGGVPAAPSGTATLLRLSPSHRSHSRTRLAATYFKCPRLPWLDGRCVQGPGTYSPRHG